MGAVEVAGALADPDEVTAGVVQLTGAAVDAGQRTLVVEQQRLVGGEELGRAHGVEVGTTGRHELHRLVDVLGEALVAAVGRVGDEALVPVVDVAQVGEAAHGEGAHEVQRGRAGVVGLHEPLRVRRARLEGEVEVVDHVAAVGRQGHALAGLVAAAAGLGVLPRHPADLHHRHGGAVGEDGGHLQDRLDPVTDVVGRGRGERLGAVATLQDERLTAGGCGHPRLQDVALTGEHQRRIRRELGDSAGQARGVRPGRLLGGREVGTGREAGEGVMVLRGAHRSRIGASRTGPSRSPHRGHPPHPVWRVPQAVGVSRPLAIANRTSAIRLCSCSLPRVFWTWFCTVRCEMNNSDAISL